jgi:tripartite-type tricarboxylate transporter receptor subunit TctC
MVILSSPCTPQAPSPIASATAASASADFYKDKTVTILVTSPAGSTNDIFAQLTATYLSELIGAKIVVENKTAAGGLVAQNEFFQIVKPDGLTILLEATGRIWPGYLMAEKGIEYDSGKFEYLSGINKGGPFLLGVSPKGPYGTIELLKLGKNLKVPTSTSTSILSLAAMGVSEALSLDTKLITGVASDPAFRALQQGEADFLIRSFDSAIKYQTHGLFKPLAQLGEKRSSLCSDIPTLGEVATLSDYQKRLTGVLFSEAIVFLAPPGTPKDRVRFFDNCLTKMFENSDFQNKIKGSFSIWLGTCSAAETNKQISTLIAHRNDFNFFTSLITKYFK